jgi:hypothetical protein
LDLGNGFFRKYAQVVETEMPSAPPFSSPGVAWRRGHSSFVWESAAESTEALEFLNGSAVAAINESKVRRPSDLGTA